MKTNLLNEGVLQRVKFIAEELRRGYFVNNGSNRAIFPAIILCTENLKDDLCLLIYSYYINDAFRISFSHKYVHVRELKTLCKSFNESSLISTNFLFFFSDFKVKNSIVFMSI